MVWMALFHFCFDLNHLGLLATRQNFYGDIFWTLQRSCIVSLFMFCAGLSLAVALEAGQGWPKFWRRWAQIVGCAALVSAGSALMFPRSWISFGVLHGFAVMLLVARVLAPMFSRTKGSLLIAGTVAVVLPHLVQHPIFDSRWLNPIGLVTHKPITEDFAPILPWMGVVLFGLAAGQWLLAHRRSLLSGSIPSVAQPLAALGRWSLSFYMLHQPVLIGLLMAYKAVLRATV